ncbi:MAG: SMC-Scp complex subunit ScpB [Oscillospiraceae bacterium]|nr:SMC-Scp complex subunit ScpB [Oscillospiraceae bacterium]
MSQNDKISAVEAVLFACGDPVEEQRLAAASGIDTDSLDDIIGQLNQRYDETGSALLVIRLGESRQLCVREEYMDNVRAAMENKKNTPLSAAAMEVLTIVAYNQPVTKSFVEHVRGIDSSSVVNSLVEKNLLEEAGRLDVPGKPIAYKTTAAFLRCFQLDSLDDLPELPNRQQLDFAELLTDDGDGGEEEETAP